MFDFVRDRGVPERVEGASRSALAKPPQRPAQILELSSAQRTGRTDREVTLDLVALLICELALERFGQKLR